MCRNRPGQMEEYCPNDFGQIDGADSELMSIEAERHRQDIWIMEWQGTRTRSCSSPSNIDHDRGRLASADLVSDTHLYEALPADTFAFRTHAIIIHSLPFSRCVARSLRLFHIWGLDMGCV
jgi:hypothetical protein